MTKQQPVLDWHERLLELADLLDDLLVDDWLVDDLLPDQRDLEAFQAQKTALAHAMRRLARRERHREPKKPFGWRV